MSAALLLTLAMAGNHNCCCPTYGSYSYGYSSGTPYSYSYGTPYGYSYGAPYGYSYATPYGSGYGYRNSSARSYAYRDSNYPSRSDANRSPSRSDGSRAPGQSYAYGSPDRGGAGSSGYQERRAGFTPQPPSQSNVVQMTDRARFEPAQITVSVGETVEWQNVSQHEHTVTANSERAKNPAHVILPQGVEPFDSGEVAPGGRFSHTFTVPGTYFYVCQPHEAMGMVGIVVVKPANEGQPEETAPRPEKDQTGGRDY